ncbi:MAG: phytoene desaturase [Methylacidiphilales bacterium]|nr:phytoene desaturase [Candidatus Methylacidiphilales bacterium]MDW8349974.1 phytoene desaturase [Verrucomicrobiae bacterium]
MLYRPNITQAKALVIGSGFGGLAAAIRLQAKGYDTTILEMRDQPGGRAYVYRQDGFTFDAGPTIITAPFLIDELFALAGKKTEDYVRIVPNHPFYRIIFADGRHFDYTGDEIKMIEEVKKFSPTDVEGYKQFVEETERIFRRAFIDLADKPFSHLTDMIRVAPDLIRLRSFESVYKLTSRYIRDPQLRIVFSFHPLLVGGNPFQSSSIYSMIHYLERKWGVHFAIGGTGALVQALVRLFKEMGGKIELNTKVKKVILSGRRAQGVQSEDGREWRAEIIVSNADVANTYRKMIPAEARKKWTDRRLENMRYSMGLFLIYFGTRCTYPYLAHHTIILSERYKGLLDDIFHHKILAKDFSLYLHAPTRTDPSLAPEGCECFYVLSPVPHLGGKINWEREKDRYAESILKTIEERVCPRLRENIITQRIFTPADFETELDAYLGSAFQFEPILTQSAWFRPHNESEDIKGLYFVGAGTHPGAGLPGVLSSAKVLDRLIPMPKATPN